MSDENKHNLIYFEGSSMRELFDRMEEWQIANQKRLLSISIQQDGGKFCCIALTNYLEVIIMDGLMYGGVAVSNHALNVYGCM